MTLGNSDLFTAAHLFSPERLTLARELRGLSRTELAQKVEKSPSAISQFESGRVGPDAQTLNSIALALGFPIGFFARRCDKLLSLDACHFRSLRSASQRDRRRLLALGAVLCEVVEFIEEQVELPAERISEAAQAAAPHLQNVDMCAEAVRRTWGLGQGPIPEVLKLLESKGSIVIPIAGSCREVDAFSFWNGKRPCIFLLFEKGATRTRFDAVHELGHLAMHADVLPGNPDVERHANAFASAFLLPRESFGSECPHRLDWEHFLELKRRWKVSLAALFRRAHQLGCLSAAGYRRAFVRLGETGQRTQERAEPQPEEPTLIQRSLKVIEDEWPIERIASNLSLSASNLSEFLAVPSL